MLGALLMACVNSGVTVGAFTSGQVTPGADVKRGYDPTNALSGGAIGSALSPSSLTNGRSLRDVAMYIASGIGSTTTYVDISGYTANPGQSSLRSLTVNGVTVTGAGADGYGYSAGVATWIYNSDVFSMPASGSVPFKASIS